MKLKKRTQGIIFAAFVIVIGIAVMDIYSADHFWPAMGDDASDMYIKSEPQYMNLFWGLTGVALLFGTAVYYAARKDWSETAAVFFTSVIFIGSRLQDIIYYLVRQQSIPEYMPHLGMTSLQLLVYCPIVVFIGIIVAEGLVRIKG